MLLPIVFLMLFDLVYCIIGGHRIMIDDAPYQLSYGDVCGAALIHNKWALTTAHCSTNHTYVRIGSTSRLQGPTITVQFHFIHPKYQLAHQFDFDVQLLQFARPLKLGRKVLAIRIGREDEENLYVSGWGYPEEKGEYHEILQQVKVRIVPMDICQEVEQSLYNYTLTERMFCAGGYGRDACQGDSGGGAVSSSGKLVGLSSFGFGCGRNMPGVYTNISNVEIRQWIRKYIGF
ncbi:trypsin-1-like isoform X2 [Anticarsia gemmatalis]|uniref:trypsin-1-like isoform X2 n=1 Tax=Anticarsia gemmatalis TaxID=129554 RepID=UPI003F767C4B